MLLHSSVIIHWVHCLIVALIFELALQGSEKQSEVRIKKFMTMMDSMTEEELNTNDIKLLQQPTRIARISRGAGRHPQDYFELLGELYRSYETCLVKDSAFQTAAQHR